MSRDVVWSVCAGRILEEIAERIAPHNRAAAQGVVDHIVKTAAQLGVRSIGRAGRVDGTYEKSIVGLPYVICYAIDQDPHGQERVVILHVIHTARHWPGPRAHCQVR